MQYTRKVFRGDTLLRDEHFTVRYDPQNTIVEVGPKAAPERQTAPKTGSKPATPASPEAPTSTTG